MRGRLDLLARNFASAVVSRFDPSTSSAWPALLMAGVFLGGALTPAAGYPTLGNLILVIDGTAALLLWRTPVRTVEAHAAARRRARDGLR